jgi:arylsulfatase A-like enzyme
MRVRSRGAHGYFDNLVLVDKTIKRLRDLMTADGSWERTTLLLTSDHSYREASLLHGRHDIRVPYIVKLAGDETPAPVSIPFNNVLTRELILSVLRGEVRTNAGAAAWLKRASANDGNRVPESTEVSKMDRGRHENPTRNR